MNRLIDIISRLLDNDRYLFCVAFAVALIVSAIIDTLIPMSIIGIIAGIAILIWIAGRKFIENKTKLF